MDKKGKVLVCGIIALALIIIAVCAAIFIGVPRAKKALAGKAVTETERIFGVKAQIKDVGASSTNTVYLKDVELKGETDGKPVLSAKEVRVTVSLPSLFRKEVVITKIACDKPELNFIRRANGTTNLDSLLGKEKSASAHPVTIEIKDGALTFVDYYLKPAAKPIKLLVEHAVFTIKPDEPVGINVKSASYGKSRFAVKGSAGLAPGEQVKLNITSEDFNANELKDLLVSVTGTRMPRISGLDAPLAVRMEISGPRGSESAQISVKANTGSIGSRSIKNLEMKLTAGPETIEMNGLQLRLEDGGFVSGWVRYRMTGDANLDMSLNCRDFPVNFLTGVVENWNPGISGLLSARGSLEGNPALRDSLRGELRFAVANGKVADVVRGKPLDFDSIDGNFIVANSGLDLRKFELRGPQMDLNLDGIVGLNGALDLNGRAEVIKAMVKDAGLNQAVLDLLPDGEKGFVFKMRVKGMFGAPKVEFSAAGTLLRGAQDQIRDAGNNIENFFNRVF